MATVSLEDAYAMPAAAPRPSTVSYEDATGTQQPETWREYLGGLAGSVSSGATFGFADELKGAVQGGIAKLRGEDYGPAYEQARDEARAELKQFRERHPLQDAGAQLYGNVGGGLAAGGALGATKLGMMAGKLMPEMAGLPAWLRTGLGFVGRNAAPAAAGGAVQGFGEGEGGFGNRAVNAAEAGAVGAPLGVGLGLAAKGAGAVGTQVARALDVSPDKTMIDLGLKNLQRDNMTVGDVAANAAKPEYAGAPMILPDVAGRNTVNLAASAANMPGPSMTAAEKVVDLRRAGGPERMQEAARSGFGGGFGDARDPRLTLEMERGTNAPPLYERSYQEGIPATAVPRAAEFMADPIGQEAMQRGLRTIELEHLARGEPFVPELYGVRRATPQESGNAPQPYSRPAGMSPSPAAVEAGADPSNPVQVAGRFVIPENSTPNMRLLDATKQGYDEIVNNLRDPRTGIVQSDRYIRAVDDSRRAFRDHLAGAGPTYGEALQAWAGPSSSRDALRRGQEAFGKSTNDIVATNTGGLDPANVPFYRVGAGDNFGSKFTDPRNVSGNARRFREDIGIQRKLADILPGDAHERLNSELEREMRIGRVNAAINPNANSQTGRILAGQDDLAGSTLTNAALEAGKKGGWQGAAFAGVQKLLDRGRGLTPAVNEIMARRLFDPNELQPLLRDLAAREQAKQLDAQMRSQLANRLLPAQGAQGERVRRTLAGQ
jgi:hypothetical protein